MARLLGLQGHVALCPLPEKCDNLFVVPSSHLSDPLLAPVEFCDGVPVLPVRPVQHVMLYRQLEPRPQVHQGPAGGGGLVVPIVIHMADCLPCIVMDVIGVVHPVLVRLQVAPPS